MYKRQTGSTLTDAEHRRAIAFACERVNGRVPVIAGTGSNETDYAVELTKSACADGADAVLVVTPYYLSLIHIFNPTHYAHVVAEALSQPLPVPVVWNSGGYDRVETLRALEGTVDIYLPDYKYPDARDAQCWAGAADYRCV